MKEDRQLPRRGVSHNRQVILISLNPVKITRSLRRRGLRGTAFRATRKASFLLQRALIGPEALRINPMGYYCNHRCPMCILQHMDADRLLELKKLDKHEGMRFEHYVRLLDSMPKGLKEVNVSGGGEPLIHRDAVNIFREIKRRDLRGSLISNGTLLSELMAQELVAMKWDRIQISIHGGDPSTYQRIHGVDDYEAMVGNLQRFDRIRHEQGAGKDCEIEAFHVIQKENVDSIDNLFEVAETIGADRIIFDPIISLSGKTWLTDNELRKARLSLKSCARESSIPCNLDDILRQLKAEQVCSQDNRPFLPAKWCSAGFDETYIHSNGDVYPCCLSNEKMGNIKERPFDEIWNNRKYSDFRKRLINGRFADYCIDSRCSLEYVLHN